MTKQGSRVGYSRRIATATALALSWAAVASTGAAATLPATPDATATATPSLPAPNAPGADLQIDYAPGSALAVARAATVAQAKSVGTPLGAPLAVVQHQKPSEAVAALLARHHAVPTPAQAQAFSDLDRLEVPLRQSLTRVIDAFMASEDATAAAYAKADPGELRQLVEHLEAPSAGAAAPSLGPDSLDFVPMLSARLVLLDAAAALDRAVAEAGVRQVRETSTSPTQTTSSTCPEPAASVPLLVAIDAAGDGKGEASCYTNDFYLVVDLGGRDAYNNNAGANAFYYGLGWPANSVGPAGALVDLGSQDDRYGNGRGLVNGGGYLGSGFLYDDGGNETYTGGALSANGGAMYGSGFLYDGWGDDRYTAGGTGTNGGVVGGSAILIDGAGNDSYTATPGSFGTNGGSNGGMGSLVDLGHGTDLYKTGGNHGGGSASQIEAGNGRGTFGTALLLDAGGSGDTYITIARLTTDVATEVDESEVPKGEVGAQIDQCRSGKTDDGDSYLFQVCAAVTGAVASVSIDDVTLAEKDSGSTTATFTISLSKQWALPVEVDYASSDGTASAGHDYTSASGTVAFSPNETSKTISVTVAGDTVTEDNESFYVVLRQVRGATIAKGRGQGRILNDDAPAVRINDLSLSEGDSGTKVFNLSVSLSVPTTKVVSFNYATADGTAIAPGDYAATSGTSSFATGTTAATISVLVNGDTVIEENEWFFVNLSGVTNATVAKAQGKATIFNDD